MAETEEIAAPEVGEDQQAAPPQTPAPTQDPPDKKLWQQLNASQLYTKDYDSFKKQFSTPEAINKLHDHLFQSNLYTKSQEDFQKQFFQPVMQPHVDLQNNINQSSSFLDNFMKSPEFIKSVDRLTETAAMQDITKKLGEGQGTQKQDATYLARPRLLRLPDQVKESRNNFLQTASQNPEVLRQAFTEAKRQNVKKSMLGDEPANNTLNKNLNASVYTMDASERGAKPETIASNAEKMKSGELDYDMQSRRPVIPEGAMSSLIRGAKEYSTAADEYDFLSNNSKEDIIKKKEEEFKSYDPDKPIYKPSGNLASLASGIGSNASMMVKAGAPAAAAGMYTGPEGAFVSGAGAAIGSLWGATDWHHQAFVNKFDEVYNASRTAGKSPDEAYEAANKEANFSGNLALATGILTGGVLGKSTGKAVATVYPKGFLPTVGKIAETAGKKILSGGAELGSINGGMKAIENIHEGKPIGEGVGDAVMGGAMFAAGLMPLVHGREIFGGKRLTEGAINTLKDGYSKAPEGEVDKALHVLVAEDHITPEQAGNVKQQIETHKVATENTPDFQSNITPEAEQLLKLVDGGQKLTVMNANLEHLAKENGIETKNEEGGTISPQTVVNKLRELQSKEKEPKIFQTKADQTKELINKLPDVQQQMYKQDPEGYLKFVADQVHSGNRGEVEKGIPKELVDMAVEKYPEHHMVKVIRPEDNPKPNIVEPIKPQAVDHTQLEADRAAEIDAAHKPNIKLEFAKPDELASSEEPVKYKQAHNEIKDKFKTLKSIIDCVWP